MLANFEAQQQPQHWKRSVFIPIPKKGNAKESSNYCTIVLISHASKVMLKILQVRLQQYMKFRCASQFQKRQRNQRSNCQHPLHHQKSKRVPEKNIYLCFIDYAKAFDCVDHHNLWTVLKEMGIPDYLTCLLRNLYAGQEATVRTGHGTTDWFKLEKEYAKVVYVKKKKKKTGLKLNSQKTRIMASGPITSWQIDGETIETVTQLILGGSIITADGDYSHEIKRCLFLGRKVMTQLSIILKSRDITFLIKVCLVKAMVFPVLMYGCLSWTIKKAECQRIDVFELWCWRGLLRVLWTARRSNQSILKEISPEYSLEGLMLKLILQYFGHLMQRTDPFENALMLGNIKGGRRRG